ncbi:thiamine pyrophosphate-dependent enzyme [Streptomyces bluensis]|uniref:thiamine pyrophosphate-dependent enzyme n=1 Tax=Streptomyces bluensis TaxID=33897 RepID=UPI0033302384
MALVSEVVGERLLAWGVGRVYGSPGQGADPLIEAFRRGGGRPDFVQPRHGEAAAFMACAHAKFTGLPGCCLAPSGPGAVQLLGGLYDARLDHQPVLALVGSEPSAGSAAHRRPAAHMERIFADVAEYCEPVTRPERAAGVIDRALRAAVSRRGVAVVLLPADLLDEEAPRPGESVEAGTSRPRPLPEAAELHRAARLLNEADKVALVVGQGASAAGQQIVRAAELLGAGIAKTVLGRDVVADDLPFVAGCVGRYGTPAAERMLRECDTVVLVGTTFPPGEWLRDPAGTRCVAVNDDATALVPSGPGDVRLLGDARATLEELLPHLRPKEGRRWRAAVETWVREWDARRRAEARQHFGHLINPATVVEELSDRLPDGALLTADAGASTAWWARNLRLRHGMRASLSGTFAAMGSGVPYAVAARLAHPDRPVIAFVGDGAFQMNGLAEMVTVKDRLEQPAGSPPLVFCVFNNRDRAQATWDRRAATGNPRLLGTSSVPDVPYAEYARLLGLHGIRCERPGKIAESWDAALAADGPVVLEFLVDAETEPPTIRAPGHAAERAGRLRALLGGRRR